MKQISHIFTLLKSIVFFIASKAITSLSKSEEEYFLIGSTYGRLRSDNSLALYNYIKALNKNIFFLDNTLNSTSDIKSIQRGSFKSFLLYHNAKAVFFSHSFSDILPNMHKASFLINHLSTPLKIFIQHGVIGVTRDKNTMHNFDKYTNTISKTSDLFITSSRYELETVKKIGVSKGKLKITGLPRFDNLMKSKNNKKSVLCFLTWNSPAQYSKRLYEILRSKATNTLINNHYEFIVYVHNMMSNDLKLSLPSYIKLADSSTPLSEYIRDASLLITDNSSVCWDFFYKRDEVIFYQPSSNWYINEEFLNKRKATNPNELTFQIETFLGGERKPVTDFFEFYDNKNAKRVFDLIESNDQNLLKQTYNQRKAINTLLKNYCKSLIYRYY